MDLAERVVIGRAALDTKTQRLAVRLPDGTVVGSVDPATSGQEIAELVWRHQPGPGFVERAAAKILGIFSRSA
jgi:hypothetical protein